MNDLPWRSMPRLTKRYLDAAQYEGDGKSRDERWDDTVPALGLRIAPKGKKTFILFYRVGRQRGSRQRLVKLGTYGVDMTLDQARTKAGQWLGLARDGRDPYAEARADTLETFSGVAAEFIEKYAKKQNRSWAETERILTVYATPRWGKRPIAEIARRDVIALVETVAEKNGPYMSNRVLAAIRRLFGWALERDMIAANPAGGVRRVGKEVSRDRVLSDDELHAFWQATGAMDYPWQPLLRVLALTAQRRTEVANLRWQDLQDLESDTPLWALPREATKADRAHSVPPAPEAAAILRILPRHEGDYVFTTGDGGRPVSGFTPVKRRLDKAMLAALQQAAKADGENPEKVALASWKLHDLRRTAASTLARMGTPPHVVAAILNHAPGATQGITAVYNRYSYAEERRTALAAWARHLTGLTYPDASAIVVAFPGLSA